MLDYPAGSGQELPRARAGDHSFEPAQRRLHRQLWNHEFSPCRMSRGIAGILLYVLAPHHIGVAPSPSSNRPLTSIATIEKVSIDFIQANAEAIMSFSPVPYVKDAKLSGSLFGSPDASGLVSGVDTQFFVDHTKPLKALDEVRQRWDWPLGGLPEGHEYLLIVPGRPRRVGSRRDARA